MQFLFIHSACVAVALLLPCALCDRITLPLQSIDRTSILISTKIENAMGAEDVAVRETEEDQKKEIHTVQKKEMTEKIKTGKGTKTAKIVIVTAIVVNATVVTAASVIANEIVGSANEIVTRIITKIGIELIIGIKTAKRTKNESATKIKGGVGTRSVVEKVIEAVETVPLTAKGKRALRETLPKNIGRNLEDLSQN